VWDPFVAVLEPEWRVRIPHLGGVDSIEAMAERVLAESPERFSLAGFSMGGRIALEMFRRAPERIERLALVGSSVHPVAEGEAERRQPLIDLARNDGMGAVAASWIPRLVPVGRQGDGELMGRLMEMTCRFSAQDYADEVHALLNRPDPRPVLDAIRCPTLIMAGREDPLSPPERNTALAGLVQGARLVLIDGCGHFPMLEAPAIANQALLEWLGAEAEGISATDPRSRERPPGPHDLPSP